LLLDERIAGGRPERTREAAGDLLVSQQGPQVAFAQRAIARAGDVPIGRRGPLPLGLQQRRQDHEGQHGHHAQEGQHQLLALAEDIEGTGHSVSQGVRENVPGRRRDLTGGGPEQ
jgi:hypothetical protein